MAAPTSIPILTYHALHAPGWDYHSNDHVALEQDLASIRELGFRVVPLATIAEAVIDGAVADLAAQRVLGISLDDGTDHDYLDFSHPGYGHLKSMARVLRESGQALGYPEGPATATAFVIASAQARTQLDRTCIAGRGQWRDVWWEEAAREGILAIANHSWDHLHPTLDSVVAKHAERGRFDTVHDFDDAEREIGDAQRLLRERLGPMAQALFAYPYGQFSDYLVSEYLPGQSLIRAAFCCGGQYVTSASTRWTIPRFTCQEHWQTPEDLREILRRA
ncbi:MAG: polysaccharide deacetylase family protein [Lysobacterales bacterium]